MAMRRRVDIPQPAPVTRCKNKNLGIFVFDPLVTASSRTQGSPGAILAGQLGPRVFSGRYQRCVNQGGNKG